MRETRRLGSRLSPIERRAERGAEIQRASKEHSSLRGLGGIEFIQRPVIAAPAAVRRIMAESGIAKLIPVQCPVNEESWRGALAPLAADQLGSSIGSHRFAPSASSRSLMRSNNLGGPSAELGRAGSLRALDGSRGVSAKTNSAEVTTQPNLQRQSAHDQRFEPHGLRRQGTQHSTEVYCAHNDQEQRHM